MAKETSHFALEEGFQGEVVADRTASAAVLAAFVGIEGLRVVVRNVPQAEDLDNVIKAANELIFDAVTIRLTFAELLF